MGPTVPTMAGMSLLSALVVAGVLAVPPRIALSLAPAPMLPPDVARRAVAEAAAVWQPYGLHIVVLEGAEPIAPGDVVLRVVFVRRPPARLPSAALGAIDFDRDGAPGHVITVFVDRVLDLLAHARVMDRPVSDWPPSLRNAVVGRALGRVLAHEIGHFVLRTRGHAESGLMQAAQTSGDLAEPGRQRFRLRN